MMGRILCWTGLLLSGASLASATPVLRLSQTVVTEQNNVLQAYNAGDGTLSPQVLMPEGVSWVTASVGGACPSEDHPSCVLIRFDFNAAGLEQRVYTATVTVFAPGAADSPQTVVAMAQFTYGTRGITVESYISQAATCDVPFSPSCNLYSYSGNSLSVDTQDGGMWLSVVGQGWTTLACPLTFSMHIAPVGMAPDIYSGKIVSAAGGYVVQPPPQTDSAIMHLVPQPLATPSPPRINLTLAQGGPVMAYPFIPAISLNPAGTAPATGVVATGSGISASIAQGMVLVTVDPGPLAPGEYTGNMTIACSQANCPVVVPVNLTIVGAGSPIAANVVDNATFQWDVAAPGEVLLVKGPQLSSSPPAFANGASLPTTLGGASVLVNGVAAPLYYSSANQIAFQLPGSTPTGARNSVSVRRDNQTSGGFLLPNIVARAPRIVAVTDSSYNLRDAYHPAHAGETLILWAIGLGQTNPTVDDGEPAPSNPLAMTTAVPQVSFGSSISASPAFTGLSPGAVGLYQVNVTIPPSVPVGHIAVKLVYPDATSNAVPLTIQ